MDYYNILGVNKNATQEEIKRAYRKMATLYHPDKGGDTAKFQEIQSAYNILSDENKRQQYDNPGFQHPGFSFQFGPGMNPFEEILKQFHQHSRQKIYTTVVFITLEQVALGGSQNIQITTPSGPQLFKIDIPRGIEDGAQIRYDNLLSDGLLQIQFRIQPHSIFNRRGLDLYMSKNISIFDLICGTKLDIIDITNKKIEVSINNKTQPGTTLRIPNHGLQNNHQIGDLYVIINAEIPKNISNELLEAIENERRKT